MSFSRIDLIQYRPEAPAGAREHLRQRLRQALPPAAESLLQPTLPGVYNGGDLLWKSRGDRAALDAAAQQLRQEQDGIAHVDSAVYEDGESGGEWSKQGVYRALLLCVKTATAADTVARFEREMRAMPRYIHSIRAWRLSRVVQAAGARAWTHVWEQRYDSLPGLTGTYMMHPYHWAWVDRWFDPESPDWIVDTHLCHSFCTLM
jgi:hypothetical protein